MSIKSPITFGEIKFLKKILVKDIQNLYLEGLNISVEKYFKDLDYIGLYECLDTGYQFFYPFQIEGNESFYLELEKNKWYYQKWKWEYKMTNLYIDPGQNVLEIGCGRGYFLSHLKNRGINVKGLELNKEAIRSAEQNEINVLDLQIEEYSSQTDEKYNVVCAFQVLEHVWNIHDFITSCINLLKSRGLLIFAIPNNKSFFFKETKLLNKCNERYINQLQTLALNLPPHHLGRWNRNSLMKLVDFFPELKLRTIIEEPICDGRLELNRQLLNNENNVLKVFKKIINKNCLTLGDSLLVVYERK